MANAGQIRVLIADDHTMVRQALRNALQAFPNIEVVGEAGDGDEAVVATAKLQPKVVVMDVNMAKMDGITATRLIKAQHQGDCSDWTLRRFERLPVSRIEECRSLSGPQQGERPCTTCTVRSNRLQRELAITPLNLILGRVSLAARGSSLARINTECWDSRCFMR